jgi:hypothetical protein
MPNFMSLPRLLSLLMLLLMLGLVSQLSGCASGSYTAQGAGKGGTTGAISGAVGGLVSALVFGGDPAEAAARGAVYGGAVGATAGAMAGSEADRQVKQQQEAKLEKIRQQIGTDAYDGLEALAECRHDEALQQANKAQQSDNPNFSLAGLWLEVLTYADTKDENKARSLFPVLVEKDWNISTEAQAEENMRKTLNSLMDIRQEFNLPRVCSG